MVFDSTAVDAYRSGSLAVGETLAEILDSIEEGEQVCAALPAMSALTAITDSDTALDVQRLAGHPGVRLISTRGDHVFAAARLAHRLGIRNEIAAAAILALKNNAPLLTSYGAAFRDSKNPMLAMLPIDIED